MKSAPGNIAAGSFKSYQKHARRDKPSKDSRSEGNPLRKIFCRLWPACWMKPKILSEITGKTHGIKFKMKPPRKPKKQKMKTPRAMEPETRSRGDGRTRDLPRGAVIPIGVLSKDDQTLERRQIFVPRL